MLKIETKNAPAPLGPYSQAVVSGGMVYVAMQLPISPKAEDPVVESEAEVEVQTRQVLENVQAIVEAANSSMAQVAKVTLYLTDLTDGKTVNPIYQEYFSKSDVLPARSLIEVTSLPFGYKIAVDVMAVIKG